MDNSAEMDLNCTVCGTKVVQNYCPQCGQLKGKKDTTFASMLKDFFMSILDLEKSVFAGILLVISNPKKIINNYWAGNRNYYPSPGKVLIYALAIAAFHLTYINSQIFGASVISEQVDDQIVFWIIFFPLLSISSLLTFINRKKSLTKHLVSILYISGSFFILLTVISDIFTLTFGDFEQFFVLFLFLLLVLAWNSIVMEQGRGIGRILLGTLLQIVVFICLILVVGIVILMLDPNSITLNTDVAY